MRHTPGEYRRYFQNNNAGKHSFAGTKEQFEIGDFVESGGKVYQIYGFFRSAHAKDNEIDWIRVNRTSEQGIVIWADFYPSELELKIRPVDYDYEKHMLCTESEWR
jgi:hypothetical protein